MRVNYPHGNLEERYAGDKTDSFHRVLSATALAFFELNLVEPSDHFGCFLNKFFFGTNSVFSSIITRHKHYFFGTENDVSSILIHRYI